MNNPSQFDGQTVDINGTVENTIWDSAVSRGAYQVFDGSGDIWVVTDQALPSKGIEVNVKGTLAPAFTLGNETLGTVINQTQRN